MRRLELPDLTRLFDTFTDSAFRLETRQVYDVSGEAEAIAAFEAGRPLSEVTANMRRWYDRVRTHTAEGKRWQRVRIVERPLTRYTRYELFSYQGNVQAGEDIRVADRSWHPDLSSLVVDFWGFDLDTDHPVAVVMEYDDEGRFVAPHLVSDRQGLRSCIRERDLALRHAVPLADYREERASA